MRPRSFGAWSFRRIDQIAKICNQQTSERRETIRAVFILGQSCPKPEISTAGPEKWHFWLALA